MNISFATGIYALIAEEFDSREKEDLTSQLRELLEECDFAHMARTYERELLLLCSLMYYCLNLRSSSDSFARTAGQDYCGLSAVAPVPSTVPAAYAPLSGAHFLLLHGALSLTDYVCAPSHQTALSRSLLTALPRMLTTGGAGPASALGMLSALALVHRTILLVDGRFVTPLHRLLQVRLVAEDPVSAGQRRSPDRKMLVLAWLVAFKLGVQGVPRLWAAMQWWRTKLASGVTQSCEEWGDSHSPPPPQQQQQQQQQGRLLSRKCALCMEFIAADQPACAPCGHVFCQGCLARWLVEQARCPLCRAPLRPQQVRMLYNVA